MPAGSCRRSHSRALVMARPAFSVHGQMVRTGAIIFSRPHVSHTWLDIISAFTDVLNAVACCAGLETVRIASGAGTNTRDNPLNLAEFVPSTDAGGLFDNKVRAASGRTQKAS